MENREWKEKTAAAEDALVVHGSFARLKKLMRRAKEGEKLCIGFLGGSITQGSLASAPEKCYAALVFQWWKEKFPQSEFTFVNAGIGGTNSLFGAARAQTDLLQYRPDFAVVDFTVNDDNTAFFQETFEGVLRELWLDENAPAVMVLNNAFYDDGRNAQERHNQVAQAYQIPCVSVRESLYRLICDGTYAAADVTPDNLHPNDKGHRFLADMLIYPLEQAYQDIENDEEEPKCPSPVTNNRFEHAKRYQAANSEAKLNGFQSDTREKRELLDLYKCGWMGCNPGDQIVFDLKCSHISVQFLRAVKRDRLTAEAVVDGDEAHAVFLDGNFDEDWGDCLALQTVFESGQRGGHTLKITIRDTELSGAKPFYLVSVITD